MSNVIEEQTQQPMQEKTGNKPPIKTNWKFLAIVVVAAILVGGGALWYVRLLNQQISQLETSNVTLQIPKEKKSEIDTSTWQTYRNDEFGFEVRSPESLPVFVSAEHNTQTIIAVGNADIFGIVVNENSTFAETIQVLKRIWGEELVDAGGKVDFLGLHAFELQTGSEKGASKILVLEHPRKDLVFMIQVAESFFEEGLPDQILSTFRFVE